jgi:hypothetical protein
MEWLGQPQRERELTREEFLSVDKRAHWEMYYSTTNRRLAFEDVIVYVNKDGTVVWVEHR